MKHRTFSLPDALQETYYAASATPGKDFTAEAEQLIADCCDTLGGVPPLMRFHISDIANQYALLRALTEKLPSLVSIVGQPPADGSRIAMEAWAPDQSVTWHFDDKHAIAALRNYRLLFHKSRPAHAEGSEAQMRATWDELEQYLASFGASVPGELHRTWIYCRDIDNNYAGLVKARREWFADHGLLPQTHYIASTGIGAEAEPYSLLVQTDSFALLDGAPQQIEYMHAPGHLSPTHIYGVTFERGVRILTGDRSHYFLSGTASIDRNGCIVHPGDIAGQTRRMVENVQALLRAHGGDLCDLHQAVVYLRDPADCRIASAILDELLPEATPRIILRGTVCRPGWLIEMDGMAVNANGDASFKVLR